MSEDKSDYTTTPGGLEKRSFRVIRGNGSGALADTPRLLADLGDNSYFRIAGYADDAGMPILYFYIRRPHLVMGVKPNALKKEVVAALCPATFLEERWPELATHTKRVDRFREEAIDIAYARGVYSTTRTRGLGAWADAGRLVYSLGDRLLVGGETLALDALPGTVNFYEGRPRMALALNNPLSTADGKKFLQLCSSFSWERAINGPMFAGWCFLAGICGALAWRPHVYVYGPKSSGKTWIMTHVMRPALGSIGLHVQSASTSEAGIRQILRSDARPVLFDEAEGENESARKRMQGVFALARQASSESGGVILKGTQHGDALSYQVRSMFCFSSISPSMIQSSDDSRITELGLIERNDPAIFAKIQRDAAALMTADFAERLAARALQNFGHIRDAAAVFHPPIRARLKSQRLADQCAPLFAASWCLINDAPPGAEHAKQLVNDADWGLEDEIIETPDWQRLLGYIVSARIRVEHVDRAREHSIDSLIDAALRRTAAMDSVLAEEALRRCGLRIDRAKGIDYLAVANSHPMLAKFLRDTAYAVKWSRVLRTCPGAYCSTSPSHFGKQLSSRCVRIPLEIFGNDD